MKNIVLFCLILLLSSAVMAGTVRMVNDSGSWIVLKPDGSQLDTTGSNCEGLTEALNYSIQNGLSFYLEAGGIIPVGENVNVLTCNETIYLPAMQNANIFMETVTLHFTASVTGPGIQFDSCMGCHITINGQIGHRGSGAAILFKPENPPPFDTFAGPTINDSSFIIGSAVTEPGGNQYGQPEVVLFDVSSGSISNNIFIFNEINSQRESYHGIRILGGDSNFHFFANTITCPHLHNSRGMGVNIGSDGANIYGNKWDLMIQPSSGGGGFLTYGHHDQIELSVLHHQAYENGGSGMGMESLKLESSSGNNSIIVRILQGTEGITTFQDLGTDNVILGAISVTNHKYSIKPFW